MKNRWIIALLLSATTLLSASDRGAELSEEKCTSCHMTSSSSAKLKDGKMHAPPMWGVMKKVRNNFKTKEEGIAFITDYTMNPASEKMLFPKATEEYFGLMPSMRETVTNEEMKQIAEYLYR